MARSRSAAAKVWATVLSELAGVPVLLEWDSPWWCVRWVDGPTWLLLSERAAALSGFGVGFPLAAAQLRFSRRLSPLAVAVGWLVHGSRPTAGEQEQGMTAQYAVEQWCTDTSYPQQRAGDAVVSAARVLAAVSRGDAAVMAALITAAVPPIEPAVLTGGFTGGLPGRVVSYRGPGRGGPPQHLLQPPDRAPVTGQPATAGPAAPAVTSTVCQRCGAALPSRSGGRGGRPAQYCSDRCRVAAHRSRTRAAADR